LSAIVTEAAKLWAAGATTQHNANKSAFMIWPSLDKQGQNSRLRGWLQLRIELPRSPPVGFRIVMQVLEALRSDMPVDANTGIAGEPP
jgi:hypothetical protein